MWYYYIRIGKILKAKSDLVSEISKDIAQIFFAVLAVESFTKSIIDWKIVGIGVFLSLVFWICSFISYKSK